MVLVGHYQWSEHQYTISKFIDPDAHKALVLKLENKVSKVSASNLIENIRLYEKLLQLEPSRLKFKKKLDHYVGLKKSKERRLAEAIRAREAAVKAKEEAAVKAKEEAKKAEKIKSGFHCLSSWDGSHEQLNRHTKRRMRDPESYQHIKTKIGPVNDSGYHPLIMSYRSKNGFGGYTSGLVVAKIDNKTCQATIVKSAD